MEDVVWRADTGAYHYRSTGAPVLMPPVLTATTAPGMPPTAYGEGFWRWLASPEATNLLLLLILFAILLRGD